MNGDGEIRELREHIESLERRVNRLTRVIVVLSITILILFLGLYVPVVLEIVGVVLLISAILFAALSFIVGIRLLLEWLSPSQKNEINSPNHVSRGSH